MPTRSQSPVIKYVLKRTSGKRQPNFTLYNFLWRCTYLILSLHIKISLDSSFIFFYHPFTLYLLLMSAFVCQFSGNHTPSTFLSIFTTNLSFWCLTIHTHPHCYTQYLAPVFDHQHSKKPSLASLQILLSLKIPNLISTTTAFVCSITSFMVKLLPWYLVQPCDTATGKWYLFFTKDQNYHDNSNPVYPIFYTRNPNNQLLQIFLTVCFTPLCCFSKYFTQPVCDFPPLFIFLFISSKFCDKIY